MKKLSLLFVVVTVSVSIFGQDFKPTGTLSELLTQKVMGYTILDTCTGDLNRDAYRDLIIVYKDIQEEDQTVEPEKEPVRPLVIYVGQADGSYKLKMKNNNVVYCYSCGGMMGDPYSALVIKNGYFTVEHYGGSSWHWTRLVTFKYSTKDQTWYLHRDGGDSFHASDPETIITRVKTTKDFGVIPFEKFDINKESE